MNATMQSRIKDHGRKLLAIFPGATERDPVKLCKKLRRLESGAHAIALRLCNGPEYTDDDEIETVCASIIETVRVILGDGPTIFLNRDPRGYALKIDDYAMECGQYDLHRDWGGYGIIAPDLSE